jgi:phage terminase large subunit
MALKIDFSKFYELMNSAFWDLFEDRSRIRVSVGGGGSGKSHHSFQEMIYKILAEPGHNYLITRKVANTNKNSTYALTVQLINQLGLSSVFKINKTDMTITVKHTGYMIVFKGLDDIEKIKSFTFSKGILTDIIIEEASEITQADFNQLNIRLRGRRTGEQSKIIFQITLLLNPITDTHWIKREFFDIKSYQKTSSVYIVHTTYLDNKFIDDDYKAVLEGYKNIDYEFYRVYCLGEWGAFGNLIFKNWTFMRCPYKEEDFDSVYAGQDFGFIHPQVIVKIGFKDGKMYTFNELCAFEKTNKEIIEMNEEEQVVKKGERIICDSAEPSKIKEWVQYGYGAIKAVKGKDSVTRGIDYIKSQIWIIDDSRCPRTAQEVQQFHWKEDKDGKSTDQPVELFEDAIKAHIYALEPNSRSQLKPSVLSGTKSDSKKKLIEVKKKERHQRMEIIKAQRLQKKEAEQKLANKL